MRSVETIAAIATASGGGVGIVRLSGPASERILRAIVPSLPRAIVSHKLVLGRAIDPRSGQELDEVLAVMMRAPRSFTGEDVAELHGHGGAANLAALLDATLAAGARLAAPGEFTRRAFVAGKIDLTQAEATAALIGARDARTLRAAQALRRGELGRRIDDARRRVVLELADLEGRLDFPEESAGEAVDETGRLTRIAALAAELARLGAGFRRPLGVVPDVLLVGRVNAGKSSLLNALCGQERALVDELPGTTRDLVEAELEVEGALVRLIDTAGERAATGLEARGQALGRARWAGAALALLVFDGARGWQDADAVLAAELEAAGLPSLSIANKADLPAGATKPRAIPVSSRTGVGLAELRRAIDGALGAGRDEEVGVATARQAEALARAAAAIERGVHACGGGTDEIAAPEVAAVELRRALHHLGEVTGETADEAVLDAIFARFCIGK